MLLAMPFIIQAMRVLLQYRSLVLQCPFLHHCGNGAIARCIATMPTGTAATHPYFTDGLLRTYNTLVRQNDDRIPYGVNKQPRYQTERNTENGFVYFSK